MTGLLPRGGKGALKLKPGSSSEVSLVTWWHVDNSTINILLSAPLALHCAGSLVAQNLNKNQVLPDTGVTAPKQFQDPRTSASECSKRVWIFTPCVCGWVSFLTIFCNYLDLRPLCKNSLRLPGGGDTATPSDPFSFLACFLWLKVLNKRVTCIDSCATTEWRTVGNTGIYRPISHAIRAKRVCLSRGCSFLLMVPSRHHYCCLIGHYLLLCRLP